MTGYETLNFFIAIAPIISASAVAVAAVGIWVGIRAMNRSNEARAVQAAEDRKATQALMAALERQGAALEELVRRTALPQRGPAE